MRLLKITLLLLTILVMSFSCDKQAATEEPYIVPYADQYATDIKAIDKFLDTYTMTATLANDYEDVVFTELTSPIDVSQTIRVKYASELKYKMITSNDVNYKVYYIEFREGTEDKPTTVDSTFVNYKGMLLNKKTTGYVDADGFEKNQIFDQAKSPVWFKLNRVIGGWTKIMSLFKSGTTAPGANNSITYANFGAGVMFLPSGLAYYNSAQANIPAYSPLIFTFSLKKVNYTDDDYDRIDSRYEGFDEVKQKYTKDTDGDGRLDYLDQDDDGDGYLTKEEIRKPATHLGLNPFYPFDPIVDNPMTTIDETEPKGIPDKTGEGTSVSRIRRHLDKTIKPPYTVY